MNVWFRPKRKLNDSFGEEDPLDDSAVRKTFLKKDDQSKDFDSTPESKKSKGENSDICKKFPDIQTDP